MFAGRLEFAWRSNQKKDEYHEETVPQSIKNRRFSKHARIHSIDPAVLTTLFVDPFSVQVTQLANTVHKGFLVIPENVKEDLKLKFGKELCRCLFGLSFH